MTSDRRDAVDAATQRAALARSLSLVVIALDQLTKFIVLSDARTVRSACGDSRTSQLDARVQQPAPHSVFWPISEGWQRWLFTLLAIAVSAVLAVWLRRIRARRVAHGAAARR